MGNNLLFECYVMSEPEISGMDVDPESGMGVERGQLWIKLDRSNWLTDLNMNEFGKRLMRSLNSAQQDRGDLENEVELS